MSGQILCLGPVQGRGAMGHLVIVPIASQRLPTPRRDQTQPGRGRRDKGSPGTSLDWTRPSWGKRGRGGSPAQDTPFNHHDPHTHVLDLLIMLDQT